MVIPYLFCVPFLNFYAIVKFYLKGFDEILFHLRKRKIFKFFLWFILGPFVILFLALVDNYNVLRVITDYKIKDQEEDELNELD